MTWILSLSFSRHCPCLMPLDQEGFIRSQHRQSSLSSSIFAELWLNLGIKGLGDADNRVRFFLVPWSRQGEWKEERERVNSVGSSGSHPYLHWDLIRLGVLSVQMTQKWKDWREGFQIEKKDSSVGAVTITRPVAWLQDWKTIPQR